MQSRNVKNAQGIDVSHYQGVIDWKKVKNAGKSFAIIKATQGTSFVDDRFLANVNGARSAGLLVGAYHFLNAINPDAAIAEARHFWDVIKTAGPLDFPPVLDYEDNPGHNSKATITAIAKAFLDEIRRLSGRKPIIYTGNHFTANFDASLGGYLLWIARYSSSPPNNAPAWGRWDIWQYSSSGKVPGIAGNVDLNEFDGTEAQLRELLHPTPVAPPPKPAPGPDYVGHWAEAAIRSVMSSGLMSAYEDNFAPNRPLTRGELAAVLLRAGYITGEGGKPMSNKKDYAGHWAEDAIDAVIKAGLMSGRDEDVFAPDEAVTRAELAVVLTRLINQ